MVYEPSTNHEHAVVEAVLSFLEKRYGEPLRHRRRPEQEVRDTKAIELVASGTTRKFAIEHTRLNSFKGQIADDAQLLERLWPVVPHLDGSLPGTFELAIRARDISRLSKHKTAAALAGIVEWVRREAPHLDPRRQFDEENRAGTFTAISEPSRIVPFELRLTRESDQGSLIYIARLLPPDFEKEREADVLRALDAKNPKLARWTGPDTVRVLILETRDFQLQSFAVVAKAVEAASRSRTDMPELVYLVETDAGTWSLYVIKDNDAYAVRRARDVGPFMIGIDTPEGPNS